MHSLYTGVTLSGKTTLARAHARYFAQLGHSVLVYDPVHTATVGGDWGTENVVSDFDDLIDLMATEGPHHVYIDEAGEIFGLSDKDRYPLLTRGRHHGLFINLIATRPKMLAPTVRTQCAVAHVFRLAPGDLNEIGEDFGHGQLGKTLLEHGDYLTLYSGRSRIEKNNVFQQLNRGSL
jgi:hypothetical protein